MFSKTASEISPEARILTLLLHEDGLRYPGLHKLMDEAVNWSKLAELAETHGIVGLIAPRISEFHREGLIPDSVARQLEIKALGTAAASMRIQAEIQKLATLSRGINVPLIVMKGAAVASLLYAKPHIRQAGDIDLLCKEADYTRLHDAMVAAGYTTDESRELPDKCSSLETSFEQHFRPAGNGVLIELHVDSIKLGVKPSHSDSIWDRAVPVRIGDADLLSMSPRDMALMLPVHLHRHGFTRLAWFKDIDLLVRKYGDEIDWDKVYADARLEGASASLWLTFDLLEEMLGTPFPAGLVSRFKPSPITQFLWRMVWTRKSIIGLEAATRRRAVQFSLSESWRGTLPSLILMGRRREKLRILLSRVIHNKGRIAKGTSGHGHH